jgi:hypothetical protein
MRNHQLGDLLLRNDGNGAFTDVTTEAGLAGSLSWLPSDYDNDGFPDLLLTGTGSPRLYRNALRPEITKFVLWAIGFGPPHPHREFINGKFADVSELAELNNLAGVFLSAAWIDIDQDGDLAALARFAETPDDARAPKEKATQAVVANPAECWRSTRGRRGAPPSPLLTKFNPSYLAASRDNTGTCRWSGRG